MFAGVITVEASSGSRGGEDIDGAQVVEAVGNPHVIPLQRRMRSPDMRYRLLDTMRVYVQRKLIESGEADIVDAGQATYTVNFAKTRAPIYQSFEGGSVRSLR